MSMSSFSVARRFLVLALAFSGVKPKEARWQGAQKWQLMESMEELVASMQIHSSPFSILLSYHRVPSLSGFSVGLGKWKHSLGSEGCQRLGSGESRSLQTGRPFTAVISSCWSRSCAVHPLPPPGLGAETVTAPQRC